jgi:putative oxidoreductase
MDSGLLLLRVPLGLLIAAHGSQKLLGWFGGYGLAGTSGFFETIGFRPGRLFATLASGAEFVGGLLITIGLAGPIGPALMVSVMIVAAMSVHLPNGVFAQNNGIEVPLLYGVAGAALALTGPGRFSLDALMGLTALSAPELTWAALGVGVLGGIVNVALRRGPATATA